MRTAWILEGERFGGENNWVPITQLELALSSLSISATALIARAENSARPDLRGCSHHPHRFEDKRTFTASTDDIEHAVEPIL